MSLRFLSAALLLAAALAAPRTHADERVVRFCVDPDNLPYYGSHGYQVIGESGIPGGARSWYMERPISA